MYKIFLTLFMFIFCTVNGDESHKIAPVAYKGRFIPLDVYAGNVLHEFYGKEKIKKAHLEQFNLSDSSALTFFIKFYFFGSKPFDDAPLFRIAHAELKKSLNLNLKEDYFSYNELKPALLKIGTTHFLNMQEKRLKSTAESLLMLMNEYGNWKGSLTKDNKEIHLGETPLLKQLQELGTYFKALPTKNPEIWVPLHAVTLKIADKNGALKFIQNFTPYKDDRFFAIRNTYLALENSFLNDDEAAIKTNLQALGESLNEAYVAIEGKPAIKAFQKTYRYPTRLQLQSEYFYTHYKLIEVTILFYAIALIGFLLAKTLKNKKIKYFSIICFTLGFLLHTFILILRCYILERPPVSNMFETVIYVPWIAIIAGIFFFYYTKNGLLLIASSFCALALLVLLLVTDLSRQLESPQAVLDSQYWLTIHVMLIVGSYGVFCLSGILGHIYLSEPLLNRYNDNERKTLKFAVLQTMYLGSFMLIPGTILGGVWAAESWGRFWDWDPKESWAFISCCIYLIVIHAYRFKKIKAFGLCVGSVIGLLSISFTWYGVNYILGTGLHSYGFGTGGEIYYYLFLIAELTFLMIVSYKNKSNPLTKRVEM